MADYIFQQPIHLSELHISKSADSLYVFGGVLATFNLGGTFFYPGLAKSIRFSSQRGHWMFVSADNMQKGEIDPEKASWQFRDMIAEINADLIIGLIGGYARSAYQIIDPVYPGYTDSFFSFLVSGRILSVTKPREIRLNIAQVLSNN